MIISRKNFEKALERERKEMQEKIYEKQWRDDQHRFMCERLDAMERRLAKLERLAGFSEPVYDENRKSVSHD